MSLFNPVLSVDNTLLCTFQRLCTSFQDTGVLIYGRYVLSGHSSRQQISVGTYSRRGTYLRGVTVTVPGVGSYVFALSPKFCQPLQKHVSVASNFSLLFLAKVVQYEKLRFEISVAISLPVWRMQQIQSVRWPRSRLR